MTDAAGGTQQVNTQAQTHVPFVTWEIQDKHILDIEDAINDGHDLLTDKSRDMGATWDHIVVFHDQWLFKGDRNLLEISRKEDCVDTLGKTGEAGSDPGTLFGKHDYVNRWLPAWMKPPYERKRMHLTNLRNNSRIDGETSSATAGSSDRRTAILLDEMAKMDEGSSIKRSTKDVTACRLANSTPDGAGTAFSEWRNSGQIKIFPLMYWEHPEKGRGREVEVNTTYPHLGPWLIRTPWLTEQEKVQSPKEIAIEIMADHIGSGDTFFEPGNIEIHRALYARPPLFRKIIDFDHKLSLSAIPETIAKRIVENIKVYQDNVKAPWRFWVELEGRRPNQNKTYVMACDISKGQGASNSTCTVLTKEDREKVAEFASAQFPPYEFARLVCAAAVWFGGRGGRPLLIWEANGPGWDFGRQVVKILQYPLYYRDRAVGTTDEKQGKRYGWHSTGDKKMQCLGILRRAYAHGGFINHSDEALTECLSYVHYEGGGIGPACLVEESDSAKKCHGDRVIGDMLSLVGLGDAPFKKPKTADTNPRTMAYRRKQAMTRTKQKNRTAQKTFDFTGGMIHAR